MIYPKMRFFYVFLSLAVVSLLKAQPTSYDPKDHSTGIFKRSTYECPQEGNGGDSYLNELKNRDLPSSTLDTLSVSSILSTLPQDFPTRKNRSQWTQADKDKVVQD